MLFVVEFDLLDFLDISTLILVGIEKGIVEEKD